MIEQQGRVAAVEGDRAWVRVGGVSGCPACDAGRGCGAGIFGRLLNRRQARVSVANRLELQPGAPVLIGLSEQAFLGLVMRLYGWPLLAGLAGAGLAWLFVAGFFPPGDWRIDAVVALTALAAAGSTLYRGKRSLQRTFTRFSPVMLDADPRLDCESNGRHQ